MKNQQDETDRVWIIMEDEPNIRLIMRTLSQRWGRSMLEFEDGHQGMRWVEDFQAGCYDGPIPELMICDVMHPGPLGYEVCEAIRQNPELDEMAIVIATSYRHSPEAAQRIRAVADHFIPKPYPRPDELRAILDDVIEARQRKVSGQIGEGGAA